MIITADKLHSRENLLSIIDKKYLNEDRKKPRRDVQSDSVYLSLSPGCHKSLLLGSMLQMSDDSGTRIKMIK